MFHKTARHLVVYPIADTSALCAFLTFRFETEPNYKELDKDDDVLYMWVRTVHQNDDDQISTVMRFMCQKFIDEKASELLYYQWPNSWVVNGRWTDSC